MSKVEDLLILRYKVSEEGYPDMIFQPGQILFLDRIDEQTKQPYWLSPKRNNWYQPFFDRFPSIFKPLSWYEEREESELIGLYVKHIEKGIVSRVNSPISTDGNHFVLDNMKNSVPFSQWIPITEKEYLEYISHSNE